MNETMGVTSTTVTRVEDTAIIFEGGGMRNAYTAGFVSMLLEQGIEFPHVSGVSAGSSHLCNYVSRDITRVHSTFVDIADDPEFAGLTHLRKGHGFFNAEYIYQKICYPDGAMPFDLATFLQNPAQVRVCAFNASRGQSRWFTKEDMSTLETLGPAVRASSTLPVMMPPVVIDSDTYVDGAIGDNGGIALDAALHDGYRKVVVVLTRPRHYVKPPMKSSVGALLKTVYRDFPSVYEGVAQRHIRYNAARRLLDRMEADGRAFLFCPDNLWIKNTEIRKPRLEAAFRSGYYQSYRELGRLKEFLGIA
ncbi:patatin family protein [Schaalia sp. ZJ405]|uniref:patatin-like phospholipase family protein n=1 Tax=unclassified Schaalia TaxID=2691889 RepID=UPI0013EBEC0A|nr:MULTISPECIES: patatin family protein [unclassified Schaalia]QPK81446.1 patatin family protein [Schaalia sp. ZJ405]